MCEGVAQYQEAGKDPYRIFIGEEVLKNMDSTFEGRPVYVRHVDEVNLDDIQNEADGFVNKSFYNPVDGKHWVEFIVVSDKGHEAILQKKWKLSNAYFPKAYKGGGEWHGVDYVKEVARGEYEHLAIVPNPRYEESVIFTPEEFKQYNNEKENELKRLANEKEKGESSMLNLFKKTKVDNAKELEETIVTLPKSKIDMSVIDVVNELDAIKNMHGYANEEHMVKVGEEEMSVKQLTKKHAAMCQELEEMKKPKDGEEKENDDGDDLDEDLKKKKKEDSSKKNSKASDSEDESDDESEEDSKDESEEDEMAEKLANAKKKADKAEKAERFKNLKNAHLDAPKGDDEKYEFAGDQVARGKTRYGSGR